MPARHYSIISVTKSITGKEVRFIPAGYTVVPSRFVEMTMSLEIPVGSVCN